MFRSLVLMAAAALLALGQTNRAVVLGTGSFTSFVEDMDRSLAFYRDAFDMDVPALPASGQRPYNQANPQLFKFFDIPGAKERHQSARVTGTRVTLEMMEIQDVPHQNLTLRIQDPGNATVVFLVRDVDAALARAVQAKAPVVTPGGKPVTFVDGARSVLIRDLDDRFIELRQLPGAPATGDILDMRLSITVNDMDAAKKIYRDVLGFQVEGETVFAAEPAMRALTGLAKAEFRRSRVQLTGSPLWIEFVEFRGVDRKPLVMKIQDRGAARLQLRVQDVDAVVTAAKAAGLNIHSTGGIAHAIPPNLKGALVADPNNFLLTPYSACDGCAPGIGVPAKGK